MSNEFPASNNAPTTPPVPPSTPPDTPTPLPPIKINTVWDVLKIVAFVLFWYITTDANQALNAAVDYAKLAGAKTTLIGVSYLGAKIGLLQGLIMAVQALAVIWASPTLFTYLGPVLSSAFRTPIRLVAEFRRAVSSKSQDGSNDDNKDGKNGQKTSWPETAPVFEAGYCPSCSKSGDQVSIT